MKKIVLGAVAVAALAGCGGASDEPDETATSNPSETPSTSAPPETTSVSVELHDNGSLDALFNGRDGVCTSRNFGVAFSIALDNPNMSSDELAELIPTTVVTLKDAAGTTIGVDELEQYGGRFTKSEGCHWTVTFPEVKPSDFYEVVVENDAFSKSMTEAGNADSNTYLAFTF